MRKFISFLAVTLLVINVVLSVPVFASAQTINPKYHYTIQDLRNLHDFLLSRPTEEILTDKPYDLNNDNIWDVFDMVLMRQLLLNQKDESKMKLKIEVNGHTLSAALTDNSSAKALAELIKNEPLTLNLSDYGNFEKVGPLPQRLPTNDENITTEPGDIILYQGNQITIYYDVNTWKFTRLGHIDIAQDELKAILGEGDVTVTLSMTE